MSDTFRKAYRDLTPAERESVEAIKAAAEAFESALNNGMLPPLPGRGRHFSLAMTNLEQAVMWAVKGLSV
jgi:hypothetical protein